jgi:hypothetical protein
VDRKKLAPNELKDSLRQRLEDAEKRVSLAQLAIDWQLLLVDELCAQARPDVRVAQEVLTMLQESLVWREVRADQIRRELDSLTRDES